MRRLIPPRKKTLRLELEYYVTAWNTVLRQVVKDMDIIALLRNAHPAYRMTFAAACLEAGMIGEHAYEEFRVGPQPKMDRLNWRF